MDASEHINQGFYCQDINRVSKTRFLGGHHIEKRQIKVYQNMEIESQRLDSLDLNRVF